MKKYLNLLIVGIFSGALVLFAQKIYFSKLEEHSSNNTKSLPVKFAALNGSIGSDAFVFAAAQSTPTVVHITTSAKMSSRQQEMDFFDPFNFFFGQPQQQRPKNDKPMPLGSGSGVIISSDGFIVTNNHVIEGAEEIEVILNDNRSFSAKLIGTDPNTDLAVIKIDADKLPNIQFANSDDVQIGQWVLAVGNPFNLSSTVTAGIVSAKARNINILRETAGNLAIESFIQTDAAVNPGNSGGALVDLQGKLIGINAAIATPTGTYAGYSFAIPSNLVSKVVKDIMDFGNVQRGFLGVQIGELDDKTAKELGLSKVEGAYISDVTKGSGADEAGIRGGDVIIKIDEHIIKTSPELQEYVARYRPDDKLNVTFLRDNKEKTVQVKLQGNKSNTLAENSKNGNILDELGIEVASLNISEAKKIGLAGGLKINKINDGIIKENTNIKEGFIITGLNNSPITNIDDFQEVLKKSRGEGVLLQGKYPNQNGTLYYAFGF
jgi:serine protease Do